MELDEKELEKEDAGECEIIESVQGDKLKKSEYMWKIISFFGRPYFWLLLAGLFAAFRVFHVSYLLLCAGGTYLISVIPLKRILQRRRPHEDCNEVEVLSDNFGPHSFPSGHTFYAATSSFSSNNR